MRIARSFVFGALMLAVSGPALAQWGPWGGDPYGRGGWGRSGWDRPGWRGPARSNRDEREGKVEVTRFVGQEGAAALGHGEIAVHVAANEVKTQGAKAAFASDLPDSKAPAGYGPSDEPAAHASDRDNATYEAAVIDQLVKLGYDTKAPSPDNGQLVELTITRSVLEPQEPPHKPVSGEMDAGVSSRGGSAVGLALNFDFTKSAKALVSTRLEARIRDRATGKALWEGRADLATRDGDSNWTEPKIATRLADALFGGFPGKSGETVTLR